MSDLIGQRLGHYEILALIGKGGTASVYRAQQLNEWNIRHQVAIKIIKSDLIESGDFLKRFVREAQTIATLQHPHILTLFDCGEHEGTAYLVMELLTGGSLFNLLRREPLNAKTADRILSQIAAALDYAHSQGIIHRDLKPQNVLLDDSGNAYLTDFGIAKLLNATMTLTDHGAVMGTPPYMAPELWEDGPIDARTDVYALGVVLVEMLTGKPPFTGSTPYSIMHKHMNQAPPSIHAMRRDLPPEVDAVIEKALGKDRQARFQSAGEMASAFSQSVAGVTAPPSAARLARTDPRKTSVPQGTVMLPRTIAGRRMRLWAGGVAALSLIALLVFAAVLSSGTGRLATETRLALAAVTQTMTQTAAPATTLTPSRPAATAKATATNTAAQAPVGDAKGKLAFVSNRDGNLEIYVMHADGTNVKRLTSLSAEDFAPCWSPDGSHIAFISNRDKIYDIWVMEADGQEKDVRRLTTGTQASFLAWSPDGKTIAFHSDLAGKYAIYLVDSDGKNMRPLTDGRADAMYPVWSPDGKSIAFVLKRDGNAEIYIMDADGKNQKRLTEGVKDDSSLAWSPDGKSIAFVLKRDGNAEIYIMDADGKNQKRLTDNPALDDSPSWSPDGKYILFVSKRDSNSEIYIMDSDGQRQFRLTTLPSEDLSPTWAH